MATEPRLETNGAAVAFFGAWPAALTELGVGLSQAFINGMTEWAALNNEIWTRGSAIQAEWTKALTGQAIDLPQLPAWMIWHNGTEQLA